MTNQEKMPESLAEWADLYVKALDKQEDLPTGGQLSLRIYTAMIDKFGETETNDAIDSRLSK